MAALGWARLVCGFVGSWVALGFVWVSFPRANSEGFSLSALTVGVELRDPRGSGTSIRSIDSWKTGEKSKKNVGKPCTFIKFFGFRRVNSITFFLQKSVGATRAKRKIIAATAKREWYVKRRDSGVVVVKTPL